MSILAENGPKFKGNTNSRNNELLAAALAYADQGVYVIPLHTPLFDSDGNLIGCTCEAFKRSKKYFEWLRSKGKDKLFDPNFKCQTPGKHPRLSDWEAQASIAPDQLRAWWHKWPTANIGGAPGKSGLVTFDLDSYKEVYGDDSDLFTMADKQTATQISGGGGEHLVYKMPAGKAYTNANNTLPPGIDIRGVGGMLVLAPSLHPSGNLYQWEEGYSLTECSPKPLPQALQAILDDASNNSTKAAKATFTAVTTERPDLLRWRVSKRVRELIGLAGVVGERSQNDMRVCTALVYAGASPDDILAVFQHNPIGTQGKYAERGPEYLARTIGKAQAFVAAHPRPDIGATVDNLLLWVRTHSFDPFIDDKFKTVDQNGKLIYRTDSTDTKVCDAILCEMKERHRLTINVGKKRLAKAAGLGSSNTALKALTRLAGWLFDVEIDPAHGAQIRLDFARFEQIDPFLASAIVYKRDHFSENDAPAGGINEYSPRKTDEPFLAGTSKAIRKRIQDIALALDIEPAQAKADYTFTALGESGLRVIDALIRAGDMTAVELVEETGKKPSAVGTALRKLRQHGIVSADRPNVFTPYTYSLSDDVWAKIEEIAPNLRTYTTAARRESKRLEAAQQWTQKGITEAQAAQNTEQAQRLELRFAKLAAQRVPQLQRLHPDLSIQEIESLAYQVAAYRRRDEADEQAFRSKRRELQEKWEADHADDIRLIRELAYAAIDDFAAQGLRKPTRSMLVNEIMKFDLFRKTLHKDEAKKFISAVVASPKQMSGYKPGRGQ